MNRANHKTESFFLSQSYKDAWSDYIRSITHYSFPVWDNIVLTASNEHQARSFKMQIESRKEFLPYRTKITVIPDEANVRVGSGGATLSVLKWLSENGGWSGKRILVIHSGGDSKRVPQYSALGKLFSPVPHMLPDGRSSTLFDEILISMASVPGRIREGMLLLSGDVLLLFNPLLMDWNGKGAAVISFKEDVETGKDHGVYLKGEDGYVKQFLHKQSVDKLKSIGAVNEAGYVDIDTGAIVFGVDVLNSLFSLVSTNGCIDEKKYRSFVNDKVRLSLYGDFQYPLASDSTYENFILEKPEAEFSMELSMCREAIWNVLRPFRIKLLRLAPAKFIHFGTTREILNFMTSEVNQYSDLSWRNVINSSLEGCSGYNSVVSRGAHVGAGCYVEVSNVHKDATVGDRTVLSYIDIHDETIPPEVVLHGLKQINGKFVCRIFGIHDNPKENKLFGKELPAKFDSLWNAPFYPERDTIKEAVEVALRLYNQVKHENWNDIEMGKSLASGFNDADLEAILVWNQRMTELVAMNNIQRLIDSKTPVSNVKSIPRLSKIQTDWFNNRLNNADYRETMRLHFYVGTATKDEKEVDKAFSALSAAIFESTKESIIENTEINIEKESVEVRLPLRVNWGGGWSDTPPYCNENGGTVLNAAILLNGERPVRVCIKRINDYKVVLESRDMDVHDEFDTVEALQYIGNPFDPYVLQKAALIACGIIPSQGGELKTILKRLGGGIWLNTEVNGVPKGSGLGTSSILAAACVKAIFEFTATSYDESDLYGRVLCMEQLMSTGGGWQDQIGGLVAGIKYITSKPGLKQDISVVNLCLSEDTINEMNERFVLIYTGQRRLARHLLREVIGKYIGNEPDTVYALNEIQRTAAMMRFELERGHVDDFAELLNKHWELSKMIDDGCTNTLINQIFDSIDDLVSGKMICGAGGGGFLQVVLKAGVSKNQIHSRLKNVFSDTDIDIWNCEILYPTNAGYSKSDNPKVIQ